MKNLIKLSYTLIFVSMSFICCSNDNPIAPGESENDPDPIVIKSPRYMRIESIKVTGFPETKSNGSDWDGPVCVGDGCKPDIEVILKKRWFLTSVLVRPAKKCKSYQHLCFYGTCL
jgi:hypothetical protein